MSRSDVQPSTEEVLCRQIDQCVEQEKESLAMLKRLEWIELSEESEDCQGYPTDITLGPRCPVCGMSEKHMADCELAGLIKKLGGGVEQYGPGELEEENRLREEKHKKMRWLADVRRVAFIFQQIEHVLRTCERYRIDTSAGTPTVLEEVPVIYGVRDGLDCDPIHRNGVVSVCAYDAETRDRIEDNWLLIDDPIKPTAKVLKMTKPLGERFENWTIHHVRMVGAQLGLFRVNACCAHGPIKYVGGVAVLA